MKHFSNFLMITLLLSAAAAQAQTKDAPAATPPASSSRTSDKIDLKKLEEKYWSAKDDEYGVIQNRTFSKSKKFYLSAAYGPLINDPYVTSRALGAMIGYYFSEDFGIEATYFNYNSKKNENVERLNSLNSSVSPNYNLVKSAMSLSATYTPFYAKMAFMNKAILYFDMGFTLGAGTTSYSQVQLPGVGLSERYFTESAPHVEVGFMQQLFINKNLAFRLDLKNTFYSQKVVPYQFNSNTTTGTETRAVNDTTLTFGVTLFTN